MNELKDALNTTQDSLIGVTKGKYSDEPCPAFGHQMLKYFAFEPGYINLNHGEAHTWIKSLEIASASNSLSGSYGSLPLPVLEATDTLTRECEANPDRFLRVTYMPLVRTVRAQLASLINASTDECVLVQNATHGISTILHNFAWAQGDVVVGGTYSHRLLTICSHLVCHFCSYDDIWRSIPLPAVLRRHSSVSDGLHFPIEISRISCNDH